VVNFHGQFVNCDNMLCDPKPVQKPHPPIWLGGDSEGAFRRIARLADGWHGLLGGSPGARREEPTLAHFAARVQQMREIAAKQGRDPDTITLSVKANCRIGPEDDPRPFFGPASKIVDSVKQLEELGLELVVLAPNLEAQPTSLDVVDQLASEVLTQLG
jgi:alkanesulfonate monooxygenase SsuD/methylene tetrahydromethanopterin reductase-like flavin-dependent oxidoreductase (luciferase family)